MNKPASPASLVGRKVRLSMNVMFETITFSGVIIKESEDEVTVHIPARIRELKWTSFPGAAYRFPRDKAQRNLIDKATGEPQ